MKYLIIIISIILLSTIAYLDNERLKQDEPIKQEDIVAIEHQFPIRDLEELNEIDDMDSLIAFILLTEK